MRGFKSSFLSLPLLFVLNYATGIWAARSLGTDGRGLLGEWLLWAQLLAAFGMNALHDGVVYLAAKPNANARAVNAACLQATFLVSLVLVVASYVAYPYLVTEAQLQEQQHLWLFCLIIAVMMLNTPLSGLLLGRQQFLGWNALGLTFPLGYLLFIGPWLFFCSSPLRAFQLALLSGYAFSSIFCLYAAWRSGGLSFLFLGTELKTLFIYTAKSQPAQVFFIFARQLDKLAVARWLSSSEYGLYIAAAALPMGLTPITGKLMQLASPKITAQPDLAGARLVFGRYLRLGGAFSFLVALFLFFLRHPLMALFGQDFISGVPILVVLGFGLVPLCLANMGKSFLLARGLPQATSKLELWSFCTTALLLILLLPNFQALGAALSLSLSALARFFFVHLLLKKSMGFGLLENLVQIKEDWTWAKSRLKK